MKTGGGLTTAVVGPCSRERGTPILVVAHTFRADKGGNRGKGKSSPRAPEYAQFYRLTGGFSDVAIRAVRARGLERDARVVKTDRRRRATERRAGSRSVAFVPAAARAASGQTASALLTRVMNS